MWPRGRIVKTQKATIKRQTMPLGSTHLMLYVHRNRKTISELSRSLQIYIYTYRDGLFALKKIILRTPILKFF